MDATTALAQSPPSDSAATRCSAPGRTPFSCRIAPCGQPRGAVALGSGDAASTRQSPKPRPPTPTLRRAG
eukprot:1041537-Lingulodinium_polyedra.AAC.1